MGSLLIEICENIEINAIVVKIAKNIPVTYKYWAGIQRGISLSQLN